MFRRVGGARVAEFFQTYYLAQNFGVGWIVKDVLYAAELAFLLSAVNWRSPRSVALLVCKAACLWGVLLLANSVFYMIFSGGNMIVVTYPLVAALAIVCIRGLRVTSRIAQAAVERFHSMRQLNERMKEQRFDLLLLDIDMPKVDGIRFGLYLRENKDRTEIVYVSNREDRVFESFQVHPFGFVRKSHFLKDIGAVIEAFLAAQRAEDKEGEQLLVPQGKSGIVSIPIHSIIYIEGSGKQQLVHLDDRKDVLALRSSMENLESKVADKGFLRIHKGYLVNYRRISVIARTQAELTNGEVLPLSRSNAARIREEYLRLSQAARSTLL